MSGSQLKISADTSEVKKSLLDLSKNLKGLGSAKVSIFTEADKRFMNTELKKELTAMKTRLKENRNEIKNMIESQKELVKGSEQELEVRRKIIDAYKTQSKLGREMGDLKALKKGGIPAGGGGGIGDMLMSGLSGIGKLLGGGALAVGAMGIAKGIQGTNQYVGGASNRVRLKGLGVDEDSFGSAKQLAGAGLTEQEMIDRRIQATSILGRQGTDNNNELQKAMFERSNGLQGGTMTGVSASLRGNFGGQGANEAQQKLQATIIASGIEDALAPYLETMTSLLSNINDNGVTNTSDVTALMAAFTKEGQRTPEQMGKTFQGMNSAIQGSSGDQNAFLQSAFAKAGIGGSTIGGTKYAIEAGGLFGLDKNAMAKRGYNPELLKSMEAQGQFRGVGDRAEATLNTFKSQSSMNPNQSIESVTDANQMEGMNNMANSMFGTKGGQGFDALKLLQKVQDNKMKPKEFEEQLQKMKDSKDPQVERLEKINSSLAGQTDILTNIDTNLAESLGKEGVQVRNQAKTLENTGTAAATDVAKAVNNSGATQAVGGAVNRGATAVTSGSLGEKLYNVTHPNEIQPSNAPTIDPEPMAKAISNVLKNLGITNNISIKNNPNSSRVTDKIYK